MQTKEERFNSIVAENEERIKRVCGYYVQNIEDRKDIYQEVLVNIWKSLDGFRGEAALSTWIYRIAVNTSLNFTGKAFKQMKFVVSADTPNLEALLCDSDNESGVKQESRLDQLQTVINTLSVIDKMIISLMLEGLSMKGIADVVGITEPNVKVKIHRIKQELRKKLVGGDYEQL